ncbi:MAG TPA: DNA polymerase III subunit delta' [Vicinamibacterales bacterium]|nr:DNA polymerase III subunit delta' [Vicinamibacterales bacterium]
MSAVPFSSVIGHRPVVDLLRETVRRGRVPQSLLFAGPDGVGKRTVALALAQAVNCPNRKDGDACGTCSTCDRIARGVHSDVTFVDTGGEASIKIDVLRERILHVIGYRPFEAERRVYIIDQADEMLHPAQNALLKSLEEPPPSAILMLVTAYPDTLLPTIQSRCRRLRFGPLAEADVTRVLVERCRIDRATARELASVAGGSVARALEEKAGDLREDRQAALDLLVAAGRNGGGVLARLQAAKSLVEHDSDRRDREALGMRFTVVASLLRDLGVLASGASAALANADLESELRSLASSYDLRRVATGFSALADAQHSLDRNGSPKIISDWVALSI